jgi:alpha-mannosidase
MNFQELIVLLPCHSLEDFPLYHEGDDADGLLAAWSALWHPALIADARKAPGWQRADAPPADVAGRLFVIPRVAEDRLPVGFVDRAIAEGAVLIRKIHNRPEILAACFQARGGDAGVDPELAADFLALGYCYLQVELLTRQMRYASNLDQAALGRFAVAAADAALCGDAAEAQTQLTACFNLLGEARKYFYPVDSYLVDLTLVAATTLGSALAAEMNAASAANLLLPAHLLREIEHAHPQTLQSLRSALSRSAVSLVGGELEERELPLLPLETVLADLQAGRAEFERVLGRAPVAFGRRRAGLVPTLPQVLHKLGFEGALHVTLDDGRFPLGSQSKVRWEGSDATSIDTLARLPRDAGKSETFLDFARRMGEAMDSDHVATVIFAHWPGLASPWYADMQRIARYTSALGKFITLDEYFTQTYSPTQTARFLADEYRTPYLKQAIIRRQADPISRFVEIHRRQADAAATAALATLARLLAPPGATGANRAAASSSGQPLSAGRAELAAAVADLAAALPRSTAAVAAASLVFNPLSFARQLPVERPPSGGAATAASATIGPGSAPDDPPGTVADRPEPTVVEVPAMGFALVDWTALGDGPNQKSRRREQPIAAENRLANEFFELSIHPTGGGIQGIRMHRQRGNRISQQVALRSAGAPAAPGEVWRDPDEDAVYSSMRADSIEITACTPAIGEITSRGSLVDAEGRRLAGFCQRTQVWLGSRLVRLEFELDPVEELRADPWNSYFAARFAWSDATADVFRGVHAGRHPTEAKRIEAPEYIEIESPQGNTSILPGGLPYHRRSAMRIVDSLLIVRGETARRFQMAVGINVPNPAAAAAELLAPVTVWHGTMAPPAGTHTGWLFHVDARSVIATDWSPLWPEQTEPVGTGQPMQGAAVGFQVRLLETSGRPVTAGLRAYRAMGQARKVDFRGQPIGELAVEQDRVTCQLAGHEWAQIEVRW